MAIWRLSFSINLTNLLCTRRLATTQNSVIFKLKHDTKNLNILPQKPKKPLLPYMQYFLSTMNQVKEKYPDYTYVDIVKKVAEQWKQLDSQTKNNMLKQYNEQVSIYKQQLIDYETSLTDDQKMQIKKQLRRDALENDQVKELLAKLGKPKRPMPSFILFLANKRKEKDPQISQTEFVTKMAQEWRDMTEENKNKYVTEATQLFKKYKIEMKKWEEKIIETGYNPRKYNSKSKYNTNIGMREE